MWNIHSTTELLKDMSAATDSDELLQLFIEYVRRSIHVERALVLNNKALTAPQYRVVLKTQWVDDARTGSVAHPNEVRSGGLLADVLYSGSFRRIGDLCPESSDPGFDLLRGCHSLMAFPLFDKGASVGAVVMLGPSTKICDDNSLCALAIMSAMLERADCAQTLAHQLETSCRTLDCELRAAADVQRWLLPPSTNGTTHARIAASYKTARHSGGDYYDVGELPDGRLGVLIADVSGKGAAAAVLMAVLRTIIHDEVDRSRLTDPAALLDYADARLCAYGLPLRAAFVTAFACTLDMTSGVLTYASAGHNPPRLLHASNRSIVPLEGAGTTPLAALDDPCRHTEETVVLEGGDLVLFYTDGITETRSPEGEFFGSNRLDEVLRVLPEPLTPASAVEAISIAVQQFAGDKPLSDDQTLLAVCRPRCGENRGVSKEHD
ncbi:MAG: SpoIIE family protein phosphatase [Phycisphaeraceae bacterium]|nr:SpoIIE family protein phosphatase [Phycisphaeraceae bacterium]